MTVSTNHYAEYHLLYGIMNTPVRPYPFPHFYAEDVFPAGFYSELVNSFPVPRSMKPLAEARGADPEDYPERFVLPLTSQSGELPAAWTRIGEFIRSEGFRDTMLWKFQQIVAPRMQASTRLHSELILVDDRKNYSIGPHTDNPAKVLTALFYLPTGNEHPEIGTSIYMPNNPEFKCPGGVHHEFAGFQKVRTMPYKPNSLFAFAKTDNSFHAVDPIPELKSRRQLLIYDIYTA